MEKLICGSDVKTPIEYSGKSKFCEFSMYVKKGHYECGDSAFIYGDGKKFMAAVLDGVSGEPGAAFASSDAAAAILNHLKDLDSINETELKEAFTKAHLAIRLGSTTVTILILEKNGKFILASIGDSPAYGIDKKGILNLELPLARSVGDKDSVLKFFYFRNVITTSLGGASDINIQIKSGNLEKGEIIILASDCLSDNLYVEVKDGYVTESSGKRDLKALISKKKNLHAIVTTLTKEIEKRVAHGQRVETKDTILVPKEDDLAIIVIRQ
jgi:serine/threonine protein phosphatase PrpC